MGDFLIRIVTGWLILGPIVGLCIVAAFHPDLIMPIVLLAMLSFLAYVIGDEVLS